MSPRVDFHELCPEATFVAPMEGISHFEFRNMIAERGGVSVVCTEFVRITNQTQPVRHLRRQVLASPGSKLSVQVMGNSAQHLADATEIVSEAGADIVDINLGCPAPRVVKKGVGAAMLRDPVHLFEVVSQMRRRTHLPLSAKIRAGFDDAQGVVTIARTLEAAGVDFLTVHPRRRCDFYRGVSDWRIIRTLKRELSIPVVGNGDIWYAADALRMQRETGADAAMLGRGAIRNPWIFIQLHQLKHGIPEVAPDGAMFVEFLESMVTRYSRAFPGRALLGPMKETARWMGRAVRDGGDFVHRALRSESVNDLLESARVLVGGRPASELDYDARGGAGERSGSTEMAQDAA